MKKLKYSSAILLLSLTMLNTATIVGTIPVLANTTIITQTEKAPTAGEVKDFGDDHEEAKKWGKDQEDKWKISEANKRVLREFSTKPEYTSKYKENSFQDREGLDTDYRKKLELFEKEVRGANSNENIVTYKNVSPESIGFAKDLVKGNQFTSDYTKFKDSMIGKDIVIDDFPSTNLSKEKPKTGEQVMIRGLLKQGAASGTIVSGEEIKVLLEEGYALHVDKISKTVIKGSNMVVIDGTFTMPSIDFKNDRTTSDAEMTKQYEGDKWKNIITSESSAGIINYCGGFHEQINNYLRTGEGGNDFIRHMIEVISEGLQVKPLEKDTTVYRWTNLSDLGFSNSATASDLIDNMLGKEIDNSSFISSSIDSTGSGGYNSSPIVLRLRLPKGTNGAYVKVLEDIPFPGENEILLDKDYKYRVDGIRSVVIKGAKKIIIDGTLLLN